MGIMESPTRQVAAAVSATSSGCFNFNEPTGSDRSSSMGYLQSSNPTYHNPHHHHHHHYHHGGTNHRDQLHDPHPPHLGPHQLNFDPHRQHQIQQVRDQQHDGGQSAYRPTDQIGPPPSISSSNGRLVDSHPTLGYIDYPSGSDQIDNQQTYQQQCDLVQLRWSASSSTSSSAHHSNSTSILQYASGQPTSSIFDHCYDHDDNLIEQHISAQAVDHHSFNYASCSDYNYHQHLYCSPVVTATVDNTSQYNYGYYDSLSHYQVAPLQPAPPQSSDLHCQSQESNTIKVHQQPHDISYSQYHGEEQDKVYALAPAAIPGLNLSQQNGVQKPPGPPSDIVQAESISKAVTVYPTPEAPSAKPFQALHHDPLRIGCGVSALSQDNDYAAAAAVTGQESIWQPAESQTQSVTVTAAAELAPTDRPAAAVAPSSTSNLFCKAKAQSAMNSSNPFESRPTEVSRTLIDLASMRRRNQCQVCGRHYARPSTLKTHLRTHTNERPFRCNVCLKTFSQAANLTAHQRVHTGERPFSCPICGRQFSQSSSVITHLRTHSGERPYRCINCERTFSDSSTLTKHCRIHSGEKPYQCEYCPLNFSQSGNLSRHLKLHLLSCASGVGAGLSCAPITTKQSCTSASPAPTAAAAPPPQPQPTSSSQSAAAAAAAAALGLRKKIRQIAPASRATSAGCLQKDCNNNTVQASSNGSSCSRSTSSSSASSVCSSGGLGEPGGPVMASTANKLPLYMPTGSSSKL